MKSILTALFLVLFISYSASAAQFTCGSESENLMVQVSETGESYHGRIHFNLTVSTQDGMTHYTGLHYDNGISSEPNEILNIQIFEKVNSSFKIKAMTKPKPCNPRSRNGCSPQPSTFVYYIGELKLDGVKTLISCNPL